MKLKLLTAVGITTSLLCQAMLPVLAEDDLEIEKQYRTLTKAVLLKGIDLEKFSLRYRRDSVDTSGWKRLRYFLTQETGAAGALAFGIIGADQFDKGRKNPLKLDQNAVKNGLRTAMITSIIAGSGSAAELGASGLQAWKNHRKGMGASAATQHVVAQLKEFDELLAKREAFVSAHRNHPMHDAAALESRVLRAFRDVGAYEFAQFHKDVRSYVVSENTFYGLNVATNVIAAVSSHKGIKGFEDPNNNGPANVLFTLAGAMTMVSPLLSSAAGKVAGNLADRKLRRTIGKIDQPNFDQLTNLSQQLADRIKGVDQDRYAAGVFRTQAYLAEGPRFRKQLDSELAMVRHLDKVAVQSNFIAPVIGGTFLTQGILGTVGFYKYHPRIRKELDLSYKGSVVGMTGSSIAVGMTALGLVSEWAYQRKLKKQDRLPEQIIERRLQTLDQLEKQIQDL